MMKVSLLKRLFLIPIISTVLTACGNTSSISVSSVSNLTSTIESVSISTDDITSSTSEIVDKKIHEIHTPLQLAYLTSKDYDVAAAFAMGNKEESRPLPYRIEYEEYSLFKGEKEVEIEVSDSPDYVDAWVFKTNDTYFDIYNCKVHTKYYFRVCEDDIYILEDTFETSKTLLRNIYIDGVTNARDLGGYQTASGKMIKQGLLYRTARINDNYTSIANITKLGTEWVKRLGFKTELDLRTTSESGIASSLLENMQYISCSWGYDKPGGIFAPENYPVIKDAFHALANKFNYPLFFHCNIGTDRTGTLALLTLSYLGVDYVNIIRDYLFSNFATIGGTRGVSNMKPLLDLIDTMEGNTLQEKVTTFLLTKIEVPEADLLAIKELLLED